MTSPREAAIAQFQAIHACAKFYGDIASVEFCERRISDLHGGGSGNLGGIYDDILRRAAMP